MKKLLSILPMLLLAGCTGKFSAQQTQFTPMAVTNNSVAHFSHVMAMSTTNSQFTHVATVGSNSFNGKLLQATGFASSGNTAYIVYNTKDDEVRGGLDILDMTAVNSPVLVSSVVSEASEYAEVKVVGTHLLMVGQKAVLDRHYGLLTVMDVSNPAHPVVSAELIFQDGFAATSVDVDGNNAYVTMPNVGVRQIDISNISAPTVVATRGDMPNTLFARRNQGKTVVLGGDTDLHVQTLDVSGSKQLATSAQEAPTRMTIDSENFLYSNAAGNLTILDLKDQANMALVSTTKIVGRGNGLATRNCYAYLADGENGLEVFNVVDRTLPVSLGLFDYAEGDSGSANNAFVMKASGVTYVFNSDGKGGVKITSVAVSDLNGCNQDDYAGTGLSCNIYDIGYQPNNVPDYSTMTPVGHFYTNQLDVPDSNYAASNPYFPSNLKHLQVNYGIECTGSWTADETGSITTSLTSDDGAILYAAKSGEALQVAINNDGLHSPSTVSTTGNIVLGQSYDLRIDYYQGPANQIALQLYKNSVANQSVSAPVTGFKH